jgi:hypothetical protein
MPRGGIDAGKIEVTGLGRNAVPSFKRVPNAALKQYLARSLITVCPFRRRDAGLLRVRGNQLSQWCCVRFNPRFCAEQIVAGLCLGPDR